MYDKSKQYFRNISWVGAESAPTFTIWGRKAPPYIINDGFNGKIKEAYEKYENIIFSGFSTLNFVLSTMAGLALRENDIGYARFLSGKVQAVAHTLEMGKYNEYSPMLDIKSIPFLKALR